jgi:hypothetical protein
VTCTTTDEATKCFNHWNSPSGKAEKRAPNPEECVQGVTTTTTTTITTVTTVTTIITATTLDGSAPTPTNILRGITPTVSSAGAFDGGADTYSAEFLTDGVKTQYGSVSGAGFWHSIGDGTDPNAWAKVVFEQRSVISRVSVTNRCGSCVRCSFLTKYNLCEERGRDARM